MKYLRACLDPRVLGALATAGVAIWVLAPGLVAAVIPLLILAACPLSMLLMMRSMSGHTAGAAGPVGDHELVLRRELVGLYERQRRLESELAAIRGEQVAGEADEGQASARAKP